MEQLADCDLATQYFQPRTLWPMLDETIDFVAACEQVYVVEYNATAQLAGLLVANGADAGKLTNVLKYDGTPMQADEVVERVLQQRGLSLDTEVNVA